MGPAIVFLLLALLVGAVVLGGVVVMHRSSTDGGSARHTSRTDRAEPAESFLVDDGAAESAPRARSAAPRTRRKPAPVAAGTAGTDREIERVAS